MNGRIRSRSIDSVLNVASAVDEDMGPELSYPTVKLHYCVVSDRLCAADELCNGCRDLFNEAISPPPYLSLPL